MNVISRKMETGGVGRDNLRDALRYASIPLISLLVFALVLPVLLAAWFGWHHYGRVLEDSERTAQRSVVALQEHAANVLETHALVLYQVADITHNKPWSQIEDDVKLQRTLADLTSRFKQVALIGLADANGRVIVSSAEGGKNVSVSERDYFIAHKRGAAQGMFFSEAFVGQLTGSSQFAISIARADANGRFDGVIFASVPVDYFTKFWQQFVPSSGYLVPLVRDDGVLLSRYPAVNNPKRLDPNGPFVRHIQHSASGIYTARSKVDGIERINAYSRVKTYPLYISYSIEKRTVLKKWRDDMMPGFFMALMVMLVLIYFWLVVVRRSYRQHTATVRWQKVANELETEVQRREKAEDALRHGQKMDALGQLAGGIAHDFNNLLMGVLGNLELMRINLEKGRIDAVSRSINAAETVANTATAITRRLLMFSRRESFTPSVVSLNDRIIVMQEMIISTLGPSIRLHLSLADELWNTRCDPNQLDTALLNLAINARDAMLDGGELFVVTDNLSTDGMQTALPDILPGDYAVLTVKDTGTGMSAEVLQRAFEPFFTTKPAGQGTGLGLAMIYGFVQEVRGHIQLESTPDIGTTVKIYLPRI